MIDPVSFMLGMLTQEFLARSLKRSQIVKLLFAMLFGLILFNVLIQIGAFGSIVAWWNALPR